MTREKQVIVMRKFKNMRTGKYCSQAAHASMKAFLSAGHLTSGETPLVFSLDDPACIAWIEGIFTKIVTCVETESELLALAAEATAAGLPTGLVQDNGLTEFGGVLTYTALGIGPAAPERIDPITRRLRLF